MAAVVIALRARNRRQRQQRQQKDERVVFQKYLDDDSGLLSVSQLKRALTDLGLEASSAEAEQVLQKYSLRGYGEGDELVDRMRSSDSPSGLDMLSFHALVSDISQLNSEISKQNTISQLARQAANALPIRERLPYERQVRVFYQGKASTFFFAVLIASNFAINCIEKQIDPGIGASRQQHSTQLWQDFDTFFNIIFLVELILNIWGCGGPLRRFWASGWNCFDFFIVTVGVVFMTGAIPPDNPLSNLKMLRAFRVFRLFKRIESLNKIIVALLLSLPGVFNAFVIVVIFLMIYAILSVEYFAPLGQEFGEHGLGQYVTFGDNGDNHTISAETPRGFNHGWEYFGTFTRALYTLFQAMTGESWSEAIARPLMFGLYKNAALVSTFFVSFLLLFQFVLINIVIAVLLDNFVEPGGDNADEDANRGGTKLSLSARDLFALGGGVGVGLDEERSSRGEADLLPVVPEANATSPQPSSRPRHAQTEAVQSAHTHGSRQQAHGGAVSASVEAKVRLIMQELAVLRRDMDDVKRQRGRGVQ